MLQVISGDSVTRPVRFNEPDPPRAVRAPPPAPSAGWLWIGPETPVYGTPVGVGAKRKRKKAQAFHAQHMRVPEDKITTAEIAQLTGMSDTWVREQLRAKGMQAITRKSCRTQWWPRAEVMEWVGEQTNGRG